MLRALILVVVLVANAVFAAYQFGWIGPWHGLLQATGREPERLQRQLAPNTLKVVSGSVSAPDAKAERDAAGESAATATPGADVASTAVAGGLATAPSLVTRSAQASAGTGAVLACLDIGPFPAQEAAHAKGLLLALLPAGQGDMQSMPIDKRWWIHLDPVPNRAAADRQLAQLRAAGVTEYFLLNNEGAPGVTVSLGLFNDRERAARLMDVAQRKGLTPQLTERPNSKSRIVYRIAGVSTAVAGQMRNFARQQWSSQTVRDCPSPAGSPPVTH
ncbi:SPOR domain-containing protein [Pandoraea terrae]|uniref:SPOR domain-containing protein n=1 Tax=Pandoraea terrae TaxID=1537710 RepID=A0A5E4YDM2_9BURK|nr:SPOR domain-containing protein [Pandoraea terrae]VVE46931.1 SPOR domain-containing protein [Pandoraea terrae]